MYPRFSARCLIRGGHLKLSNGKNALTGNQLKFGRTATPASSRLAGWVSKQRARASQSFGAGQQRVGAGEMCKRKRKTHLPRYSRLLVLCHDSLSAESEI